MRALKGTVAIAATAWVACGPLGTRPGSPTPMGVEKATGLETCRLVKDPLHPMIVEWPAANRARLQAASAGGPVLVHYEGCSLEVLTDCHVRNAATYDLVRTTPAEDAVDMASASDLYADLPLGAVELEGLIAQGKRLRLTHVAVGERVLGRAPTVLEGDCDGATHYVESMVLGAFSLEASSSARRVGSFGGDRVESEQVQGSSGDVTACQARGLDAGASCEGVLQIGLRALRTVGAALPTVLDGRPTRETIVIPELETIGPPAGHPSLENVDVRLMELLEAARRAELDPANSQGRIRAWDALARHPGANPYADIAARRRDEWIRVGEAEDRRIEHVLAMCPRYTADRSKLEALRKLPRALVPADDLAHYEVGFGDAYGAYEKELGPRCPSARPPKVLDGMVSVPGGVFTMGSDEFDDTKPTHLVAVKAFDMDATEVTVAAYRACVQGRACTPPGSGNGQTWGLGDGRLPVNLVTWEQAQTYCSWAGKRLPTEEEWEYAARGTDGRKYPWGSTEFSDRGFDTAVICSTISDAPRLPCPVGSHPAGASPFGLQDMAGNVGEWTSSRYTPDYALGGDVSDWRVRRGGSVDWGNNWYVLGRLRSDRRSAADPNRADADTGFRCARSSKGRAGSD
jgi:formylglycine-generating enzyme required for sulfatase activity